MNDLLQPGQHLDPDQLNAFVEGVLPEHERIQTLAHLTDCPHCRQIVFLAQQAQQANEPVPVKAAATWRDWFRFHPLSMLGAASAALACALIVTVTLHLHHSAPPPATETAKVEPVQSLPPVAPREEAPIAMPSAPERPAAKAIPPPARQSLALSAPPANPIQGGAILADTSTNEDNARVHTQLRRAEPTAAAPSPAPPYPPSPSAADAIAGASVENLPVNGRAFIGTHAGVTASTLQILQATVAPRPLPSKLPIATTVSSGALILAADSAGTLFVSKNGGEPWQAVEQQWQGKVVRLALAPQAIDQIASKKQQTETKDSTDNRVVAPSSFQLTTEAGVIWVSEDGMHWRQQ